MTMPEVAITAELPGRAIEWLEEESLIRLNTGVQITDEAKLIDFIGSADAVLTLLANPVTDRVLAATKATILELVRSLISL
jgi:hypothetical protein